MCGSADSVGEMAEEVPDGYAARNGDVERMFCATLGYLETHVTLVDDGLIDTVDFVAEDESISASGLRGEVL